MHDAFPNHLRRGGPDGPTRAVLDEGRGHACGVRLQAPNQHTSTTRARQPEGVVRLPNGSTERSARTYSRGGSRASDLNLGCGRQVAVASLSHGPSAPATTRPFKSSATQGPSGTAPQPPPLSSSPSQRHEPYCRLPPRTAPSRCRTAVRQAQATAAEPPERSFCTVSTRRESHQTAPIHIKCAASDRTGPANCTPSASGSSTHQLA